MLFPMKTVLYFYINTFLSTVDRDSSVGIATRYGLDGPGIESRCGARFSAPVQTGPGAHPASCRMGTGSFSGVKRPGRGADHPLPSTRRGHERVELYLYSPSGPQWPVIGWTDLEWFTIVKISSLSRAVFPNYILSSALRHVFLFHVTEMLGVKRWVFMKREFKLLSSIVTRLQRWGNSKHHSWLHREDTHCAERLNVILFLREHKTLCLLSCTMLLCVVQ